MASTWKWTRLKLLWLMTAILVPLTTTPYLTTHFTLTRLLVAVQPDWLDEQYAMMTTQAWFRKKGFGRAEAEAELSDKPIGSFLLRVSSQDGNYAISVVRPGPKVEHMLVLPSYAGPSSTAPGKTQYRIGTYSTDLFNTMPKLVAYYIAHPYYEQEKLVGLVMPEEQVRSAGSPCKHGYFSHDCTCLAIDYTNDYGASMYVC
jgi:hypothetical protein